MPFLSKHGPKYESYAQRLERISRLNGCRHVIVFNRFSGGDTYCGEWKDNKKFGLGHYVSQLGKIYDGQFADHANGLGVLALKQPNKVYEQSYRGEWKDGHPDGWGDRIYKNGSFYRGNMKRGKKHGYGSMWYATGAFYDGDWKLDKRDGIGLHVRPDGDRYEGSWANNMKEGKGRYFYLVKGQMKDGWWHENNCVVGTIIDIPFRKTACYPTFHPVPEVEVIDYEKIVEAREDEEISKYAKETVPDDE